MAEGEPVGADGHEVDVLDLHPWDLGPAQEARPAASGDDTPVGRLGRDRPAGRDDGYASHRGRSMRRTARVFGCMRDSEAAHKRLAQSFA
ncbi:hypothetical protein GCM10009773_01680 [Williamsia serinedens]